MLDQRLRVACVMVAGGLTTIARGASADAPQGPIEYTRACTGPGVQCHIRIATRGGLPVLPIEASDLAPADLQKAYSIDATAGAGVTIAIVDAYSSKNLESDLAVYRKMYNLPECTVASGCLRILNSDGEPSPLPTGSDAGWEAETALDVDMVSAACPKCSLIVIQTTPGELDAGVREAAALVPDAINTSWGSVENGGEVAREATYHNPGIGMFAASGDMGNDTGGTGPEYPATSAYVVGVGGTSLVKNPLSMTFTENAWSLAGSSCSKSIAAPSFTPPAAAAACAMRASSDVSADADPQTGVAIYESAGGGWLDVGGTSAAAPIVAATLAASGHGDITPDFVYRHPEAFLDITSGSNGTCGTALCDAGSGWDGPTGLGTPNQALLAAIGGGVGPAIAITSPPDGATESAGFAINVTAGSDTAHVDLAVDGVRVAAFGPPFAVVVPASVASGAHAFTVSAYDGDHNVQTAQLQATIDDGGCSAGGSPAGIGLAALGLVGLVTKRRGRRIFPFNM